MTARQATYAVRVGGSLDEFNTRKHADAYSCAFQPNVSISVANRGDDEVVNPRLVINGRRNWHSLDDIKAEIVRGGMTDEEKTFAVWDWCRRNISCGPTYGNALWAENASVVRFMNSFGTGACGTFHLAMPLIAQYVGVTSDSGVLADGSHAVQRQHYGGADHYFDCMLSVGGAGQPKGHFGLALDNDTVPGAAELRADHYLVDRVGSSPGHYGNVIYHGPGSGFWKMDPNWKDPRTMALTLRPGETLYREWQPAPDSWLGSVKTSCNAQGYIEYAPRLTDTQVARFARSSVNISASGRTLTNTDSARPGEIVYEMRCPYVMTGGSVSVACGAPERVAVAISFDGANWRALQDFGAGLPRSASLDKLPEFRSPTYTHSFLVRISLPVGGEVSDIRIKARFQTYIPSLPGLGAGLNTVRYQDDTQGSRKIVITHTWRERSGQVPGPPVLKSPANGAAAPFSSRFSWTAPPGVRADAYEFLLSPRADFAWPLIADLHCVRYSADTSFVPESHDAFIDGRTYYWRVRARSKDGAWGPWSKPGRFIARGPAAPANLRMAVAADGRTSLEWDAPASGQKPLRYEVYGCDEPGFTPLRSARPYSKTAPRPANLIAAVTTRKADITRRREAFFRVVSVDANGSRSVPTVCLEAPHPALLPSPEFRAAAGETTKIRLPIRRNSGMRALHLRKGVIRVNPDRIDVRLVGAPQWLSVDAASGELTASPPQNVSGAWSFKAELAGGSGEGATREYRVVARP